MKTPQILNFKLRHPRRNLPTNVSRKRGESNFVVAFSKVYIASRQTGGFSGSEFALAGFGIADFIWLAWRHTDATEEGTAMSVEQIKTRLAKQKLSAFEMKLTDWRKGLSQAYRYSYFADKAILVLPPEVAKTARQSLELFRKSGVGLWGFNKSTGVIRKHFTPRYSTARNAQARQKALESICSSIKFSKLRKKPQSVGKRL